MKHWGFARAALVAASLFAASLLALPASAADDESSLHDLIGVLRDRGVIGENDYESIASKNAAYEAKQAEERKPALSFWGDFRFRNENFLYSEDDTGVEKTDRQRFRYRLRLSAKAEVNDHASVVMRFVSGNDDNRSTNQTLGSGVDFDTDDLRIDLAYAHVTPFAHGKLGENGTLAFELGKVENPFVWKTGKDFMLWDHDITLEGVTMLSSYAPCEGLEAFLRGGYYVIDENSSHKDPHMWVVQTGFEGEAAGSVAFGARASYYDFGSLDPAFSMRGANGAGGVTEGGGNIVDGLTGSVGNEDLQVVEATAYLKLLTNTRFPLLVYGTYSNNLSAEGSGLTTASQDDTAWGAGVEIGNKKLLLVGAGYWHIEANAFPSQFIDSDLFDGRTNREGWAAYAAREIWKNTEVDFTAFISDDIEDDVPPYGDSVPNSDRVRLQADVVFKFK